MFNSKSDPGFWNVEAICRNTPYFIIVYFALHYLLRISLSANLEVGEARLVGATDWQLLYNSINPPLYNWLSRITLELMAWNWHLALPLLKNLLLMATFLLAYDLVRRMSGSRISATMAVISLMLIPQVTWYFQVSFTHSVLGAFAVVAVLHAFALMVERGTWGAYIWFALAFSIGTLAKFNFFFFMGAFFIAILIHARGRKILRRGRSLISLIVYLSFTGPVLYAVMIHLKQSSERMQKLYNGSSLERWVDLPYLGIDGSIAMLGAILGSIGILLLTYFIAYKKSPFAGQTPSSGITDSLDMYTRILESTIIIGLSVFLLIVFFGDIHQVQAHYLTPLLILTPFLLVLKWPVSRNREAVKAMLRLTAVIIPAVYLAIVGQAFLGRNSLAIPYRDIAISLEKKYGSDLAIKALSNEDVGNLVINLQMARHYSEGHKPEKVLMVWRSAHNNEQIRESTTSLRETHKADAEIFTVKHGYQFGIGRDSQFVMKTRLFTIRK